MRGLHVRHARHARGLRRCRATQAAQKGCAQEAGAAIPVTRVAESRFNELRRQRLDPFRRMVPTRFEQEEPMKSSTRPRIANHNVRATEAANGNR